MAAQKGLILLETKNAILHEQVKQRLVDGRRDRDETVIKFSEFDGVDYCLSIPPEKSSMVKVQMKMRHLKTLMDGGSKEILDTLFPGMLVTPEMGYDVAVEFDCDKVEKKEEFLERISHLKMHCESGPLLRSFKALASPDGGKAGPVTTLNFRARDAMYICPRDGKVIVVMMLDFADDTEKALAKVFLQEFVEAQRSIRNAPSVAYGMKAPGELAGVPGIEKFANVDIAGFISFAVEPRHVQGAHLTKVTALLCGFRNYLAYHIKCSKTYLHMRMRHRMDEWMKVLKRAQPEVAGEKKTFGGKTFKR